MTTRLLEVIVTDAVDARAAEAGGADRLELIAAPALGGMTPAPHVVQKVLDVTHLPVRVMIRRNQDHRLRPDEIERLRRDVESLPIATEFVCGAVAHDGLPDPALAPATNAFGGRPWTFHRALDDAPDLPTAIRSALSLPGCDQVLTAGNSAGVAHGIERLRPALADRDLRAGLLIGGGVTASNLHELLAAGAQGIHLGRAVRGRNSWSSPVSAELVRSAAKVIHRR